MNGVIIAKQGFNTDSGSENQYVNTKTPLFKLYKTVQGSRSYTAQNLSQSFMGGNPDSFTIPHNLGYCPMYFLFMDRAASSVRKLVTIGDTNHPDTQVYVTAFVDNQNINVQVSSAFTTPVTGEFGYNCFIFYDRVS